MENIITETVCVHGICMPSVNDLIKIVHIFYPVSLIFQACAGLVCYFYFRYWMHLMPGLY